VPPSGREIVLVPNPLLAQLGLAARIGQSARQLTIELPGAGRPHALESFYYRILEARVMRTRVRGGAQIAQVRHIWRSLS
jgi:hypothetical protein